MLHKGRIYEIPEIPAFLIANVGFSLEIFVPFFILFTSYPNKRRRGP